MLHLLLYLLAWDSKGLNTEIAITIRPPSASPSGEVSSSGPRVSVKCSLYAFNNPFNGVVEYVVCTVTSMRALEVSEHSMITFPTYIQPPSQPPAPQDEHSPAQDIQNVGSDGQSVYWSPFQSGAIQNQQQQSGYVTSNSDSIPRQFDFSAEDCTRFNQNATSIQSKFLDSGDEYVSELGEFMH